jgi:enhancing lycopene biosynthesis protein 2
MKRIAVVLSGCGHKDGSEITEAVSTLIALSECKASFEVFAPDKDFSVVDHTANSLEPTQETRNVLTESARIARGHVKPLSELKTKNFDGVAFPGGFGAALHLCSWAKTGAKCEVHPEAERVIKEFHAQEKPIAAICIAPALVARMLGDEKITVTIGKNDAVTTAEIQKTGAIHEDCDVTDFVTDREHRIITTPAYMFGDAKPFEVFTGIRKAIRELVGMA